MREHYISEIVKIITPLSEKQLLYILTFIKRMFGSR